MADPLHQFQIVPLTPAVEVNLPLIGQQTIAFTNSHLAMTVAFGMVVLFLTLVTAGAKVVPGRMQAAGETLFGMIDGLVDSIIGHDGRKLFPFVFTIFTFILAMNFLGLFLSFTATSQIAVTATFGVITILMVLAIGFGKHGLKFFSLFVPSGVPWPVLPFVVIIEFVSFLLRPVTLTLRLFGNMMGGHVALKVFAGFVVVAVGGAIGWLGVPVFILSLGMTVGLTALEFLVAFLQAFVFAVLTTIYLNDVVNLGHGH
ncbi:F0F1 ATP synthase subunit A [Brevundimonas sp.]|uniref:F0F1 ATP synthase subunit A n=1 Tax=Brevundimonas sp. TaxID=1871086 RepID=UPI002D3D7FB8|nr:F0F1 ATP synthase subunit A [Brevundimonas sp.]HYC96748.1 F0F1 ATP synthase subunit A [Brevundimonas sp.]